MDYLMPKQSLKLGSRWVDKGVHTFSKVICSKVDKMARLEIELFYLDKAVLHF